MEYSGCDMHSEVTVKHIEILYGRFIKTRNAVLK